MGAGSSLQTRQALLEHMASAYPEAPLIKDGVITSRLRIGRFEKTDVKEQQLRSVNEHDDHECNAQTLCL